MPTLNLCYKQDTDLAAEAMISEGGALRQPSHDESDATLARVLRHHHSPRHPSGWNWLNSPTMMFFIGCATGIVLSLVERRRVQKRYALLLPLSDEICDGPPSGVPVIRRSLRD